MSIRNSRPKVTVMASKNWRSTDVGLFYSNERFRVDLICDYIGWSWVNLAACTSIDPELFFDRYLPAARKDLLREICDSCPVKQECLASAIANDEEGWWGGKSQQERKLDAARRRREATAAAVAQA